MQVTRGFARTSSGARLFMTGGRAPGVWAVGKEITCESGYLPDLSANLFLFRSFGFIFGMLTVLV